MKNAQTIILSLVLTVSSGIMLTGCQMITHAFDDVPVKSGFVVGVAGIAIVAIIVFLVRMGTRRKDEKAEA